MKKAKFALGLMIVFVTEKQSQVAKKKQPFLGKGQITGITVSEDEEYLYQIQFGDSTLLVKEDDIRLESQIQEAKADFEARCFPPLAIEA